MKSVSLLLLFLILIFSGFVESSYSLSCAVPNLGTVFDSSEYVFLGIVLDKNYLTLDSHMPVVTFEIKESFKGNPTEQISITVDEMWDYQFEDGFEYVVFVYRDGFSLMTNPCWPKFHAFSSTLDIVTKLSLSDDDIRSKTTDFVFNSLLPEEIEKYEENKEIIQEKRLERWDEVAFQKQMIILMGFLLIPVAGVITLLYFKKIRK